jgi:hypothetical protein
MHCLQMRLRGADLLRGIEGGDTLPLKPIRHRQAQGGLQPLNSKPKYARRPAPTEDLSHWCVPLAQGRTMVIWFQSRPTVWVKPSHHGTAPKIVEGSGSEHIAVLESPLLTLPSGTWVLYMA